MSIQVLGKASESNFARVIRYVCFSFYDNERIKVTFLCLIVFISCVVIRIRLFLIVEHSLIDT